MVRAACCEKLGLKKGPWDPEEDHILVSYIQKYGHGNWRALPKQAGLLRCGKSCRLRWTNYLRPDIKRGNFTREEEETIINLHEMLGNRWSAIAAKLPGRTDNEIKNVWHTHLKKRLLKQNQRLNSSTKNKHNIISTKSCNYSGAPKKSKSSNPSPQHLVHVPTISPQPSCSELSSVTDTSATTGQNTNCSYPVKPEITYSPENLPKIDDGFWSETPLSQNSGFSHGHNSQAYEASFTSPIDDVVGTGCGYGSKVDDGMDFWYNLLIRAGGLPELPEF